MGEIRNHALRLLPEPDAFVHLREYIEQLVESRVAPIRAKLSELERKGPRAIAPDSPADFLSREECATITGYSTKTIGRLVRTGRLPAHGLRADRIRRADLYRVMAELGRGEDGGDPALAEARAKLHGDDSDNE